MLNKCIKNFLVVARYFSLVGFGTLLGSMIEMGFNTLGIVSMVIATICFGLTFMTITIEKVEEEEVEDDE